MRGIWRRSQNWREFKQIQFPDHTGSLQGPVYDDAGKAVAATVIASKLSTPPAVITAQSAKDGTFSLAKLAAGNYMLCVRVAGGGYLDPCTWSPQSPTFQIAAGQTLTGFRLVTAKGSTVKVRINDPDHMLGSTPVPASVAPHLLIGVLTKRRTFEPLAIIAKDAAGQDHEATIPPGEPIVLQISGTGVQMMDGAGKALNATGDRVTLNQPANAPQTVVTINVRNPGK